MVSLNFSKTLISARSGSERAKKFSGTCRDDNARSCILSSTADLTLLPIVTALRGEEHLAGLRWRVGQDVDTIAGSANKVILGVIDSSFGILHTFLPGQSQTTAYGGGTGAVPGSALFAVPVSAGVGTGMGMDLYWYGHRIDGHRR
jgi:hypothetical protein